MELCILGNGSGGPFQGRHFTAQLLKVGKYRFLIDCGEGTQQQLYRYRVRYDNLAQIFISHLHGDHVFGLVGLLTSFCMRRRQEAIHLFAPPGLSELVGATFRASGVQPPFPMIFHEVDPEQSQCVFENLAVEVWTIPLRHRSPCTGWLFREKTGRRRMRKEPIDAYGIHYTQIPGLLEGADLELPDGTRVPNSELTRPPNPPRTYAFCSDTAFSERVIEAVQGVDLLYHEATFLSTQSAEAAITLHSTAAQAAEVARQAGVQRLLMGHFSSRYTDLNQHLAEARGIFPESYLAEEGKIYQIGEF
ncbi:MAG: ribonuclease Z [Saprospiraceae bacterium]